MKYKSREEKPVGNFKDRFFLECFWSPDRKTIQIIQGDRTRANKKRRFSKAIVGNSAVVTVYPANFWDTNIVVTEEIARRVAFAWMSGDYRKHGCIRV